MSFPTPTTSLRAAQQPSTRPSATRLAALLGALGVLALVTPQAQALTSDPIIPAIVEGDVVAGVGTVTSIGNLAVNSSGAFLVEVDTDNIDTNADGALVNAGGLVLAEGGSVGLPLGATLDSFDGVTLNDNGSGAFNHFLDNTVGSNDDSGVYLNGTLLIQEGDISGAAGFSAGTTYRGFFDVKINGSDDVLVLASVDDPAIATTVDRALVIASTAGGVLSAETVVVKEGDLLAGQSETVADIKSGPHNFAFNDAGQSLFIADLNGPTATDHAIYLDGTLLAQEGSPSPVIGREWSILSSAEVDLNNNGDWIVNGNLGGGGLATLLIAVNGVKHVQSTDSLPAIAPFELTSFGSGPVHLADNGSTLWYGDWNDPDTSRDTGLFLNHQLIVQEGVTAVDGSVVQTLRGIQDGYDLSDDGNWVAFEAVLADGREGAFLMQVAPWTNLGKGLAGTGGVTPCLEGVGSMTLLSANSLEFSDAAPSAFSAVIVGISEISIPFYLGTLVPSPNVIRFFFTDVSGELSLPFIVPATVIPGTALYVQGWVEDAGAPGGFSASNGVRTVITP